MPSEMQASYRARRYPWQSRATHAGIPGNPELPPPCAVTLRNSVVILTNLYTQQDQQRGSEVEGTNCSRKARFGA